MRYALLFVADGASDMSEAESQAVYEKIGAWFAEHGAAGKIVGGEELGPVSTATTLRLRDGGEPLVTDGPFIETKEVLGGWAILDVADLDEAISIAKSWPAASDTIEIRPVVDHS